MTTTKNLKKNSKVLSEAIAIFKQKFGEKYYADCCKMMNEIQEISDQLTSDVGSSDNLMLEIMEYLQNNYLQERPINKIYN